MYISSPTDKAFNEKYVPLNVRNAITEVTQKEIKSDKASSGGNLDDIKKLKELLDT